MDSFKPIGAVAAQLPIFKPLNPDYVFKNYSVHIIHHIARYLAREEVKAQLRRDGVRNVLPRQINELATQYLHDHPECWREAIQDRAGRVC
jgi:hypothetical protein